MSICNFCGIEFTKISNKKYCSVDCRNKARNKRDSNKFELVCKNCNKEYSGSRYSKKSINNFCSKNCQLEYRYKKENLQLSNCKICGIEFYQKHSNHITCSIECRNKMIKIKKENSPFCYTCENCGNSFSTPDKRQGNHIFCSHECSTIFFAKQSKVEVECPNCGKFFERAGNRKRIIFCSPKCGHEHRSKTYFGKNSPTYNHDIPDADRIAKCQKCGKTFDIKLRKKKPKFCSKKCKIASMNTSLTKPHIKICDILCEMNLKFEIEYSINGFLLDVYISDDIMIEIMGKYWHCDIRNYNEPKNEKQIKNIDKDKRKKESVFNKTGGYILYLWEDDINMRPDLCKKLIEKYVRSNGKLKNYHSMNYFLNNNLLKLNDNVLVPFFEQ